MNINRKYKLKDYSTLTFSVEKCPCKKLQSLQSVKNIVLSPLLKKKKKKPP